MSSNPPLTCPRFLLGFLIAIAIGCLPAKTYAQGQTAFDWKNTSVLAGETVAYSPDGTLIAVAGPGGIELYKGSTGRAYTSFPIGIPNARACFSPDGQTLLVGGNGAGGLVQLWNVTSGTLTGTISTGLTSVIALAYSPDGKTIALGGSTASSGALQLWSVATNKQIATFPTTASAIYTVAFSRDGTILTDGGSKPTSGFVESWHVATHGLISSFTAASVAITTVAISPDNSTLAVGGNGYYDRTGTMQLHSLATGSLIFYIATGAGSVTSIAYSPDGKTLADAGLTVVTSGYFPSSYGTVETWSLITGTLVAKATESCEFLSIAFSPDGKELAAGGVYSDEYPGLASSGGALYTFSIPNLAQSTYTATGAVNEGPISFSPDGTKLLGGGVSSTGYPNIWNATNGSWLAGIGNINTGAGGVFAFSPDGKTIASAAQRGYSAIVTFFDSTSYEVNSSFTVSANFITSLCYSPDGTKFALGIAPVTPFTDQVLIYDVATGDLLQTLTSTSNGTSLPLAFSADGTMIADGGQLGGWGGVLEVWNAATGKKIYSLATQVNEPFGVSFSPDGSTLAVAGKALPVYLGNPYGKLEIWTLATQRVKSNPILAPGSGPLSSPIYSSDGKTLYVGSDLGLQVFNTANYSMLGYFFNRSQILTLSPDGTHMAYESPTGDLGVFPTPTTIKSYAISSLTLSPTVVAGGASTVGKVTLSAPAPAGGVTLEVFVARIMNNDISTVFIPAGSKTATFTVVTTVAEEQTVLPITVSSGPYSKTVNLTITPLPPTISSFTVTPNTLVGGGLAQLTVKFPNPILGQEVPVYFTSSNASVVVPFLVYAFQGNSQALGALSSTPVLADLNVTVTATIGSSSQTQIVTVYAPTLSQITLPATSLQGGTSETGTLNLTGNTTKYGLPVFLTSSNPAVVVPSKVNIAGASTKATFTLSAKAVSASTSVTITGTTGSVSQTVTINILPSQLLSLNINPATLKGGASSVGTVTLNGPAGPSGAVVSVSSNVANANVPTTVTIPAGKTSATFKITTTAVTTQTTATISSTLNGITQTANLTIN